MNGRVGLGLLIVLVVTYFEVRDWSLLGWDITWPIAALVAAVGWGRFNLAVRPTLAIIVLGLLYDAMSHAPFGTFPLIFLATYVLVRTVSQGIFGAERIDPVTEWVLPYLMLALGSLLVWVIASIVVSAPVDAVPLMGGWVTACVMYFCLEGLFDLKNAKTRALES